MTNENDFDQIRCQLADLLLAAPDNDCAANRITPLAEELLRGVSKRGITDRSLARLRDWIAEMRRPRCPSGRLKPRKFADHALVSAVGRMP